MKNLGFIFPVPCIGMEWLHHWTKEGLLMSSNWTSAGPLIWSPTFLPLKCRDEDLMDEYMDKELAEWPNPKCYSQ